MESRKKAKEVVDSIIFGDRNVELMLWLMESYSRETFIHMIRVAEITAEILINRGCREYELIEVTKGALLHDVGKLSVPEQILNNPNCLTAEEKEVMNEHPNKGFHYLLKMNEINSGDEISKIVKDIIYMHYERNDGSGYPEGRTEIPWYVALVSTVDAYEAMIAQRCYGNRKSHANAVKTLKNDGYNSEYIEDIELLEAMHVNNVITFLNAASLNDFYMFYDIFGFEFSLNDGEVKGLREAEGEKIVITEDAIAS